MVAGAASCKILINIRTIVTNVGVVKIRKTVNPAEKVPKNKSLSTEGPPATKYYNYRSSVRETGKCRKTRVRKCGLMVVSNSPVSEQLFKLMWWFSRKNMTTERL